MVRHDDLFDPRAPRRKYEFESARGQQIPEGVLFVVQPDRKLAARIVGRALDEPDRPRPMAKKDGAKDVRIFALLEMGNVRDAETADAQVANPTKIRRR